MGFAADQLRDKALMALEEALQDVRYPPARRPLSLRFALAYLWTVSGGPREPFEEYWRALTKDEPWRYGGASQALDGIYRSLDMKREEAPSWHFWKRRQEEAYDRGINTSSSSLDGD